MFVSDKIALNPDKMYTQARKQGLLFHQYLEFIHNEINMCIYCQDDSFEWNYKLSNLYGSIIYRIYDSWSRAQFIIFDTF